MERRFKHTNTGITVTNMVNPKTYCNTGSGMVLPAFIVEDSPEFQEVFPIGYLSIKGELLDLTKPGPPFWPKDVHRQRQEAGDHQIWNLEHLNELKENRCINSVHYETSEADKEKYRLEGWQAARKGLPWIGISNDAAWNTFEDWQNEDRRAAAIGKKLILTAEVTKSCWDCEIPFKTKDENQKYCNQCLFVQQSKLKVG